MSHQLPNQIELEINHHCNRSCAYCPNSITQRSEKGDMSHETFMAIVNQLSSYQYSGKITFMFYNEPLLSKNFLSFTRIIKKRLPLATIDLYSNGTKITSMDKFLEIKNAGVDNFYITKHIGEKNYQFDTVYRELKEEDKLFVSLTDYSEIELYNRGGLLPDIEHEKSYKALPCHIPDSIMTISLEGNVISCFEDYKQQYTLGNIHQQSIAEIWNSKEYIKFRSDLLAGSRSNYKTCQNCNRIESPSMARKKKSNKHFFDQRDIAAVMQSEKSNKPLDYSKDNHSCHGFEMNFSKKFNFKKSFLTPSNTSALIAALEACQVKLGDEVIIPAYCHFTTVTAVAQTGARPIIVNVAQDLGFDETELVEKITSKTKVIIAVHMDGIYQQRDNLRAFIKEKNILILEDCTQSLGGKYQNKYLGTFGDIACFSLNQDKILSTKEAGGIISSNNPLLIEKLQALINLDHSFRASELTETIANIQLEKLDTINKKYQHHYDETVKTFHSLNLKYLNFELTTHSNTALKTTLHLKLANPKLCSFVAKKLFSFQLDFTPLTVLKAHSPLKWGKNILKDDFKLIDYLGSIDNLSSTLRYEIDPNFSSDELNFECMKIKKAFEVIDTKASYL